MKWPESLQRFLWYIGCRGPLLDWGVSCIWVEWLVSCLKANVSRGVLFGALATSCGMLPNVSRPISGHLPSRAACLQVRKALATTVAAMAASEVHALLSTIAAGGISNSTSSRQQSSMSVLQHAADCLVDLLHDEVSDAGGRAGESRVQRAIDSVWQLSRASCEEETIMC